MSRTQGFGGSQWRLHTAPLIPVNLGDPQNVTLPVGEGIYIGSPTGPGDAVYDLPLLSSVPPGTPITIVNKGSVDIEVHGSGTDPIDLAGAPGAITVQPGPPGSVTRVFIATPATDTDVATWWVLFPAG